MAGLPYLFVLLPSSCSVPSAHLPSGLVPLQQFLGIAAMNSDAEGGQEQQQVQLMTMHASKGKEFDVVAITGCYAGNVPMAW